jgi:cell division septation protein DedD
MILPLAVCSSPEKTVKEKKADSTYIFDQVPPEDFYIFETPPEKKDVLYVVQIGAFSTLDRAKQFADKSRLKLKKDIKVNYNDRNNLYVVHIHPPFNSKSEAEGYRNELWNIDDYNDAWILEFEKDR